MDKFNVGIIGCGDIGFGFDRNRKIQGALTHFKAFNDSNIFEVKAIADIRGEVRETIVKEEGIPAYGNYEKMMEENELDVVVVATNDELHYEILENLVHHDLKLVFSEKPIALSLNEAQHIVNLYHEKSVPLQVNYTRRFLEEFYHVKNVIANNEIGEIESVTLYYSRGLMHNASHYLDLVLWYFGMPESAYGITVKEGISKEDSTVSFNLRYLNGLEIRFIGLKPAKLTFAEIDIIGTGGRLKVNYKNEIEEYSVVENKTYKGYTSYELRNSRPIQFQNALPGAVDNIYKVLKNGEKLKSPGSNSLKIFQLIKCIKEKSPWQN